MLCYEKNSGETVRRLGTIIQSIFCAQSGTGICLNFWKQFGESRYPVALLPVLANFRPAFSSLRSCPLPIIPLCLSRPPLKKKKKNAWSQVTPFPTRLTAPGSPRMPYLLIEFGRSVYGHVITKFSRRGRFTYARGALLKSYFKKHLDGMIQKMCSYPEQNLY